MLGSCYHHGNNWNRRLTPRARARCWEGEIAPLAKHGVNQHSKDSTGGDNITSSKRGTDTEYTLRRLKRDAPELQDPNSDLDPLMMLEVIPAADHFQIDVEVIGSLPEGEQWSRGCGGQ